MAFCTFAKDYTQSMYTFVENQFIVKYLPLADENSLKIYLFGLYLCQNSGINFTLDDMATELGLTPLAVEQGFLFWEDFDLLKVISKTPFCVQYHPVNFAKGRPKKIPVQKYSEFSKALQALFPNKMLSQNEYTKYFQFMEEYAIKPDAMLLIINYCMDTKGKDIATNYILQVAKNWANDGIRTASQIEAKLENYKFSHKNMQMIVEVLKPKTSPRPQDFALLEKWLIDYKFDITTIAQVITYQKVTTFSKLDQILTMLFDLKYFTFTEIASYFDKVKATRKLTTQIAKKLGVYCENVDTYIENFIDKWQKFGYSDQSLLKLAQFAFGENKKSFEALDSLIIELYAQNNIDEAHLQAFFKREEHERKFLQEIFTESGITKSATAWDREQLRTWRSWQFTDEMILKAAALSFGKSNTFAYLNGILKSWKEQNIQSLKDIQKEERRPYPQNTLANTEQEREKELHKKIAKIYFNLRERAIAMAEKQQKKAEEIAGYSALERQIRSLEIDCSKAVALNEPNAEKLTQELEKFKAERQKLLVQHNIPFESLQPQYSCKLCNDTGFDKNNKYCKCYIEKIEELKKQKEN